jgi:hypothetical protein
MKIKLLPLRISQGVKSEGELLGSNIYEAICEIRALKAAIQLGAFDLVVGEPNTKGEIYLDGHNVWLEPGTWEEVL